MSKRNAVTQKINDTLLRVGSFWSEHVKDRTTPLTLVSLCFRTRLFDQLELLFNKLLDNHKFKVTNIYHKFNPEEVIYTGSDKFNQAKLEGVFGSSKLPNRFDQGEEQLWLVPLDKLNVKKGLEPIIMEVVNPIRIKAYAGHELLLNSDFFILNGFICFKLDPRDIFKDNKFLIASGDYIPSNIYNFPLSVETTQPIEHVSSFARFSQSPKYFKLALAELGGLKILKHTQRLVSKTKSRDSVTYTFEKEIVVVTYEHEELELKKLYEKDTIIGEGIQFYVPKSGRWWREVDFKGGFSLTPVTGTPGVLVPDDYVLAYAADAQQDSVGGSKLHVRLDLIGDPDVVDAYWDSVQAREVRTDRYLNTIVGIGNNDSSFEDSNFVGIMDRLQAATDAVNNKRSIDVYKKEYRNLKRLIDGEIIKPSDPNGNHTAAVKQVNALDVFFEAVLKQIGSVLIIDLNQVKTNYTEIVRFATREQPAGSCIILIVRYPNQEDSVSINNLFDTSYESFDVEDSSAESTTNLNSIIVDSYTARIDT